MDEHFILHMTEQGREITEQTYERRCFFESYLIRLDADPVTAGGDACRMEHAISAISLEKLREAFGS